MADSVREKAMQALATTITGATGVKRVNRDPRAGPTGGSTVNVNLFETSDPYSEFGPDTPVGKVTRTLAVLAEVWISGRTKPATRVNNAVAEIEKAIKSNHTLGGLVIDTRMGDVRNFVSSDENWIGAEIDLTILYRYTLADPFSA